MEGITVHGRSQPLPEMGEKHRKGAGEKLQPHCQVQLEARGQRSPDDGVQKKGMGILGVQQGKEGPTVGLREEGQFSRCCLYQNNLLSSF